MTVSQAPSQKAYQSAQNKGYPMLIGMAVWDAASVGTKMKAVFYLLLAISKCLIA